MVTVDGDPNDSTEADVADLLEQVEPASSEPVEQALEERDRIGSTDPELTGLEAEEASGLRAVLTPARNIPSAHCWS